MDNDYNIVSQIDVRFNDQTGNTLSSLDQSMSGMIEKTKNLSSMKSPIESLMNSDSMKRVAQESEKMFSQLESSSKRYAETQKKAAKEAADAEKQALEQKKKSCKRTVSMTILAACEDTF